MRQTQLLRQSLFDIAWTCYSNFARSWQPASIPVATAPLSMLAARYAPAARLSGAATPDAIPRPMAATPRPTATQPLSVNMGRGTYFLTIIDPWAGRRFLR